MFPPASTDPSTCVKQGELLLAGEDTFDGEHDPVVGPPAQCVSPFMAGTDRAVCAVTRKQVRCVVINPDPCGLAGTRAEAWARGRWRRWRWRRWRS